MGNCFGLKSEDDSTREAPSGEEDSVITLKIFQLTELKKATRNFRPKSVIGKGAFGTVYKGWVDGHTYAPTRAGVGIPVAVKKLNQARQGFRECEAEAKLLRHPNLVKLIGYYWDKSEFILVSEYMNNGSLDSHLFTKGKERLSWSTRLKIAIGAARGLSFLHNSEKSVLYTELKSSNILLDMEFNPKLSDFGLIAEVQHVRECYGYLAPEYMFTGHLCTKGNVFGFGVVLLELLTGCRALDKGRPLGQQRLVGWAKPFLFKKTKLHTIIDRSIANQLRPDEAFYIADLALMCLEDAHKKRPSMDQVIDSLLKINANSDDPSSSVGADGAGPSAS